MPFDATLPREQEECERKLKQLDPATCLAVPYSFCINGKELSVIAQESRFLDVSPDPAEVGHLNLKISLAGWDKLKSMEQNPG